MYKLYSMVAAAALLGVAGAANAFLIDDFNGGDVSIVAAAAIPPPSNGVPGNPLTEAYSVALGGAHTLQIDTAARPGSSNTISGGTWNVGNPSNGGSTGFVSWSDSAGVDLTDGAINDALELQINQIDIGTTTLTFTVTDVGGASSMLELTNQTAGQKVFLFSDFSGTADFTRAATVQLAYITGNNTDLEIDLIQTRQGVPLPGTIALLGAGLLGLGVRRRKIGA
jgi:hypothetical protein